MDMSKGLDEEGLAADQLRLDGILYNLSTIGEAIKNIPEDIRNLVPDAHWREAIRFRDRVVHHYFLSRTASSGKLSRLMCPNYAPMLKHFCKP
jgi:uncharacterized protein with HEPN domain